MTNFYELFGINLLSLCTLYHQYETIVTFSILKGAQSTKYHKRSLAISYMLFFIITRPRIIFMHLRKI